ncbi:MAG: bifunctional methylenetetrahydrofolate dehydrogenase/methenyltetrahydrofolate cyclohydrolase FolD [Nitrospinota bacterium]
MKLLNGKKIADIIKEEIATEIKTIAEKNGRTPGLAVVLVGSDLASEVYVKLKKRDCKEVGIKSFEHNLPESCSENELLSLIEQLNNNIEVDGILVQLPLPDSIDESKVLKSIAPAKDVDGFHPENVGALLQNQAILKPCTPSGTIELLDRYQIEIEGKNVVVLGRSNIVGKPLAIMMLHRNATVTIAHSKTADIKSVTKQADILCVAIGKSDFLKADMVKEGAVVIDIGVNRKADNSLTGDVDFEQVTKVASYVTPSPGGIGPLTRAMLLKNSLIAYKMNITNLAR